MKTIVFSKHAQEQMPDRGATPEEVETAITDGEVVPAKAGRKPFAEISPSGKEWKGNYYEIRQVMPVVVEEGDRIVVVTVYVFYFGGKQ